MTVGVRYETIHDKHRGIEVRRVTEDNPKAYHLLASARDAQEARTIALELAKAADDVDGKNRPEKLSITRWSYGEDGWSSTGICGVDVASMDFRPPMRAEQI